MDLDTYKLAERYIFEDVQTGCIEWARCVDRAMRGKFPLAHGPRLDVLLSRSQLATTESAFRWTARLNDVGSEISGARDRSIVTHVVGSREYEIAVSVRGPALTAISRVATERAWEQQKPDQSLIAFARDLAAACNLTYMDAADLKRWRIDPTTLTDEMWLRLDFEEHPTAFQLLFYEI